MIGKHFDRDVTLEARIARAIDLAHPARAERRQYFVRTEPRARAQGHRRNTSAVHGTEETEKRIHTEQRSNGGNARGEECDRRLAAPAVNVARVAGRSH